jgi:uncharacterized protein (TIGR00369 family)
VLTLENLRECTGLELFQKMIAGELPRPPISDTLGFYLVEAEKGRVVFQGTPQHRHYNPIGSVHGGFHATLLDSCVACAIQTTLEAGQGYTTIELKINYIRALTDRVGPVRRRRPRDPCRQADRHRRGQAGRCRRQALRPRDYDLPDL